MIWPFKKKPVPVLCSNCNQLVDYTEDDTISAVNRDYKFIICPHCSHAIILPSEEEKNQC